MTRGVDPERWKRLMSILDEALTLPPAERPRLLDRACDGDTELRREVEAMLAADASSGFMKEPAPEQAAGLIDGAEALAPGAALAEGQRIGSYRLQRRLGGGGMGEVWEATQEKPVQRIVALKLIKWGMDTREVVARFESERQALALMDHPAIAQVYDAGATEQGRPYFVMELVRGPPITEHCDTNGLGIRERLELFVRVCEGVQHAHQKAIIHRDIKPSNILVTVRDGKAVPKIIDFGIAKAIDQRLTEKTLFTRLGQVIGTPEYMSPEQADMTSQDVDVRTDVYSLGVLLYRLLTGVLPFESRELREAGFDEARRVIREETPPPPSKRLRTLRSQLSGDLDWITMKALEKDRARRYGSPAELAADVRRYLTDQPVSAGPPSALYRTGKFVRRHKLALSAVLLVFVALVAGLAVSTRSFLAARKARAAESEQRLLAESESYLARISAAHSAIQVGKVSTAREYLSACAASSRGWEWHYLASRLDDSTVTYAHHTGVVWDVAFEREGRWIVSSSRDTTAVIWDLARAAPRHTLPHTAQVMSVAIRPDGAAVLTGSEDGVLALWDAGSGERLASVTGHAALAHATFSPDGSTIASVALDGTIRIWPEDLRAPGRLMAKLDVGIDGVEYLPDGRLVTASRDNAVRIWDVHKGEPIVHIEAVPDAASSIHPWGIAISKDGARLASGSHDGKIRIWDTASGRLDRVLHGHTLRVRALAFHPSADRLVSASQDETVRVFDLRSGETLARFVGHGDRVMSVAYRPDGGQIVSGGHDGPIKFWDPARADAPITAPGEEVLSMQTGPGGEWIVGGCRDGKIRFFDPATGRPFRVLEGSASTVHSVTVSPDGRRIYSGNNDGALGVWDTDTGQLLQSIDAHPLSLMGIAISGRGDRLATTADDRRIRLWSTEPLRLLGTLDDVTPGRWMVPAFSPDGRRLAGGMRDNMAGIWSVPELKLIRTLVGHRDEVIATAFSPDGTTLATSSHDGTVRLWDAQSGRALHTLEGHTAPTDRPSFSPDGARLAGGGRDGTVILWDTKSGRSTLTLSTVSAWVFATVFDPEGSYIAGCGDGGVQLWRVPPQERYRNR